MKAKEEKSKDTSKESFCVTGSDKGQKNTLMTSAISSRMMLKHF